MKPSHSQPVPRLGQRAAWLLLGLSLFAGGASAQWQWRDANGHRVISDMPPPANVPESQILKRPGNAPAPAAAPAAAPGAATATTPARPAAGKAAAEPGRDPTLEAKVKQDEAQKRKAEDERVAKIKAENCQSARQAKATLDSGQRISRTNAQGEREFLDEKAVAEEARRAQRAIETNCS